MRDKTFPERFATIGVMFTGIVQALGILIAISDTASGKRLTVSLAELADAKIMPGDSVAVNGVCLTATKIANGNVTFDVVTETLKRSSLGRKNVADRVNLELSLTPTTPIGGHFVQGHVDALGTVRNIQSTPEDWRITVELPPETMVYVVPKGSVAIDGVSMTIAAVEGNTFTLAVIPTTLERTTLSALRVGDVVNIETDILARTVVHFLQLQQSGNAPKGGGLTLAKLIENGFA